MRTTITIDDDVAAKLDEERRRAGGSFKDTVNRLLRLGLDAARRKPAAKRFVVRARPLHAKPGVEFDCISALIEQAEGPLHK
jgi:hypothetical protein